MTRDNHNDEKAGEERAPEDQEVFNEWFDSFDDSAGFLTFLSPSEKEAHREALFNKVKDGFSLDRPLKDANQQTAPIIFQLLAHPITKVAAVLIIGVLLSVTGFYGSKILDSRDTKLVATVQKVTNVGELSKLTLPDSTTVWLGAASTLKYPKAFTSSRRLIELDGEAYFEVSHNDTLPFVVSSGSVQTRVLGTKFNVKAYEEDPEATVTLVSGKVEVRSSGEAKPVVLSPDEQFRFDKQRATGEVRSVNASVANAWKDKELVFERESFAQIAKTFERWYGVEIRFNDPSLKKEVFVYHFKEFSLRRSLEILSKLAEFSYEVKNKKVIVSVK